MEPEAPAGSAPEHDERGLEDERMPDDLPVSGDRASAGPKPACVPSRRRSATSAGAPRSARWCTACSRTRLPRRRSARRAGPGPGAETGARRGCSTATSTRSSPGWREPSRRRSDRGVGRLAATRPGPRRPARRAQLRAAARRRRPPRRRSGHDGRHRRRGSPGLPADDPLAGYEERLRGPAAGPPVVRGFLTGSIDIIAPRRRGDRHVVIDYKTNLLVPHGEDPSGLELPAGLRSPTPCRDAHYPLQAALYAVALHRFLRWRLAGYEPGRSTSAAWPTCSCAG